MKMCSGETCTIKEDEPGYENICCCECDHKGYCKQANVICVNLGEDNTCNRGNQYDKEDNK